MLKCNRELRQVNIINRLNCTTPVIHWHLAAVKALPIISRRVIWSDYNTAQERTHCQENTLVRIQLERRGLGANRPSDWHSLSKSPFAFLKWHIDPSLLQDTNSVLHKFSSEKYPNVYCAIIAFESLQTAWEKKIKLEKYVAYHDALNDGLEKLRKYYNKFDLKPAFLLGLGRFTSS